jgi:hypothetical protein
VKTIYDDGCDCDIICWEIERLWGEESYHAVFTRIWIYSTVGSCVTMLGYLHSNKKDAFAYKYDTIW